MYVDTQEVSGRPGRAVRARVSARKRTSQCAAVMVSSIPTSVTSTVAIAVLVSPQWDFFQHNSSIYYFFFLLFFVHQSSMVFLSLFYSFSSPVPKIPGCQICVSYATILMHIVIPYGVRLFSWNSWMPMNVRQYSSGKRSCGRNKFRCLKRQPRGRGRMPFQNELGKVDEKTELQHQ